MKDNFFLFVLSSSLFTSGVWAGTVAPVAQQPSWSWVGAVSMGPVWPGHGDTQTFYLTPEIEKTYAFDESTHAVFDGEVFFGAQKSLTSSLQGQFGLSVGTTSSAHVSGDIWDDADPQFNNSTFDYKIQHTFVSAKGKLLVNRDHWLIPWVSGSLGLAFNDAHSFDNTPTTPDGLATPNFGSNTETAFTYTVGIGLQAALNAHWQLGLGYEFSDWGKNSLGRASGQTLNSGPSLNHLYSNGVLFNVTYIGWRA
jgi:opacity protein-like surface antigen